MFLKCDKNIDLVNQNCVGEFPNASSMLLNVSKKPEPFTMIANRKWSTNTEILLRNCPQSNVHFLRGLSLSTSSRRNNLFWLFVSLTMYLLNLTKVELSVIQLIHDNIKNHVHYHFLSCLKNHNILSYTTWILVHWDTLYTSSSQKCYNKLAINGDNYDNYQRSKIS